jgi:predicted ATPase
MLSSKNSSEKEKKNRFTHIHLENWRNFLRIDADLQKRVFLVGPNASGKSNFLDVFRFLHDIVSVGGGFLDAVRKRGGVSDLRCLSARKFPDIAVTVRVGSGLKEIAEWEYELHFTLDNRRVPLIKKERVLRDGKEILDRPNDEDRQDPERLTQTYLQQVNVNREFREVADFFSTVRYLHIVPQLVREPDRSVGMKNDPYGGDFLEQIARTPDRTREARLNRIRDALRIAVPQLEEIALDRDERGTPHLKGKYRHWRPRGAWQNEDQFSDGTLRLLGLLWSLLDGGGPLLLEEPELSLHEGVIRFIPQILARIQRRSGRQVLLSTHSSDLLRDDGIGLDEVLLLIPSSEGTEVRPAKQIVEIEELLEAGISLPEIVIPRTRPERAEQLSLFGDGK